MILNLLPLRKVKALAVVEIGDWPVKVGDEMLLPDTPGVTTLIAMRALEDLGRVEFKHPEC